MKTEPIILQYPDLPKETKCKLYIQYGANKKITEGGRNDVFQGVKLQNVQKIINKCNQDNISKVVARFTKITGLDTYVLYKA